VVATLEQVLDEISTAMVAAERDLDAIERTLTDGYAQALSLEAERYRLEKRLAEVTQDLQRGDTSAKARELSKLATRLDANAGDLGRLRRVLADLRRHAASVRVPVAD
jgi:chromosome segregation ATPase